MLARQTYAGMARRNGSRIDAVMPCNDVFLLRQRRVGQTMAGAQEMRHLGEEPGPAIAAAADHQPVRAGTVQRLGRILLGHDVAVGDHRDVHRLLHPADEVPVGSAGVELLARSAMHGNHADAAILGDPREPRRIQVGVVPAHAHLQRHRHGHGAAPSPPGSPPQPPRHASAPSRPAGRAPPSSPGSRN